MTASGGVGGNGRWSSINALVRPANGSFGTSFFDLCNTPSGFHGPIDWLEEAGLRLAAGRLATARTAS